MRCFVAVRAVLPEVMLLPIHSSGEDAPVTVGPVEYLVVAFPGSRFTGAIAPAPADAVASAEVAEAAASAAGHTG